MSRFRRLLRWLRPVRRWGCLVPGLLLMTASTVLAGDPSPAADLVQQLGASSFERREQAERRLEQLGVEALRALREAAGDADLEIRYRARRLIGRIEHAQQGRLLETFLTDYDPELAQQLPGWPRYVELVGEDQPARELFVEMNRMEPEIMSALARPDLAPVLEKRVLEMQPSRRRPPVKMSIPAASTAVLLLASLHPGAETTADMRSLINSLVSESAFMREATRSSNPPVLRLLSAWVSEAREVAPAIRMNVGKKFALRSTTEPARELIAARAHGSQLQYAVFTLAQLGTAEQIGELENLLSNRAVLSERKRGDDEPFTCQVRDVALAAVIHLTGMHPREFGFTELRPNSNSLYALNTAGFVTDEQRQTAFRKWTLWRRMHDVNGLPENAVAGVRL